MSTSVAAIAAEAFTAVAAELPDVIKACTLTRVVQGAYNPTTGTYGETTTTATGRALIDTSTPVKDVFPAYVASVGELLIWIEGLTIVPMENDKLTIGGVDRTVTKVGDIVGAGTFFGVMAI